MNKTIQIDENTRIRIIPDNFALQYRKKSRNNRIAWHTDGYFPSLAYLAEEYLNAVPYRAMGSIRSIEELTETIKKAEDHFARLFDK
jgi:hypothetical protein